MSPYIKRTYSKRRPRASSALDKHSWWSSSETPQADTTTLGARELIASSGLSSVVSRTRSSTVGDLSSLQRLNNVNTTPNTTPTNANPQSQSNEHTFAVGQIIFMLMGTFDRSVVPLEEQGHPFVVTSTHGKRCEVAFMSSSSPNSQSSPFMKIVPKQQGSFQWPHELFLDSERDYFERKDEDGNRKGSFVHLKSRYTVPQSDLVRYNNLDLHLEDRSREKMITDIAALPPDPLTLDKWERLGPIKD